MTISSFAKGKSNGLFSGMGSAIATSTRLLYQQKSRVPLRWAARKRFRRDV
jgi:hypothetical protein